MGTMDLRPLTTDDQHLIDRALLDPQMMEHLGGAIPAEKSRETFLRQTDPAKADTTWARVIVEDGVDVGTLALWKNDHDASSEMGWMIFPEFQGRALGKRGVQMLLDEAWADGRWGAISAFPSVTNEASNALCRTLGFRLMVTTDFEYQGRTLTCNHWRIDPPEEQLQRRSSRRSSGTRARR
jgi:RimJ/RimL family protein N-acetyltransferase